jgi:hypothetical protein
MKFRLPFVKPQAMMKDAHLPSSSVAIPAMKSILALAIGSLLIVSASGEPAKGISDHGMVMPHTDFRNLLEILAQYEDKPVVVGSKEDLLRMTGVVIPGPVPFDTLRKAVRAVLLVEGYELREVGQELHLHRVLTEEQTKALNEGLGRKQQAPSELPTRGRVARGASPPKEWVIVRPEILEKSK